VTDEPLYTLAEAVAELARQDCQRTGHDYEPQGVTTDEVGDMNPTAFRCTRCLRVWTVTP
jgi:hypothetical protein